MTEDKIGLLILVIGVVASWFFGFGYGYHFATSKTAITWLREAIERGRRHDANVERLKGAFVASVRAADVVGAQRQRRDEVLAEEEWQEEFPERL